MTFTSTRFISAVLITSRHPDRLAAFYRDVLCIPLEEEEHGNTIKHYGCELGDLHFAIHPIENFDNEEPGIGAVKIAFEVLDIQGFVKHLATKGISPLYPPKQAGPLQITALKDPDGNHVEFTQLSDRWLKHLETRRAEGHCIIQAAKAAKS